MAELPQELGTCPSPPTSYEIANDVVAVALTDARLESQIQQ